MTDLDNKNLDNKINDGDLNEVSGGINVEVDSAVPSTNAIYGVVNSNSDIKKGGAVYNKMRPSKVPPRIALAKEDEKASDFKDLSINKAAKDCKDPY